MTHPTKMRVMVTMGHGDLNQMVVYADWPRPEPASGEVLIRVGACGLNNTDVNARSGWCWKTVTDGWTYPADQLRAAQAAPISKTPTGGNIVVSP